MVTRPRGASSDGTSPSDKVARAVRAARRAALPPASRVGGPSGVLPRVSCMDGVSIRFATDRKRDREIYRFGRMVGDGLVCLDVGFGRWVAWFVSLLGWLCGAIPT